MIEKDIKLELESFRENMRYRKLQINKEMILNFSSNDYLGLASDEKILKDFYKNIKFENFRLSSSSSRLIDGSYEAVMELEKKVEEIYGKACLVYNSGFDANSSLIETFFNKNSLIITDRLNHASIYDGAINSGAKIVRYNHLDINYLEKFLIKYSKDYVDILVVTETIYSMDGDTADLKSIVRLKDKYNFQLMVDEAHSYGVHGYGIAYNENLVKDIDFLVIPLGKGGASMGAYVLCSDLHKEYLINKSRKFIYSTALPPVNNFWNLYILKNMNNYKEKIKKLEELKKSSLSLLEKLGIRTFSNTHIISIIVGRNDLAVKLSEILKEYGYLAYSIKEPTVPKNTARLRISLMPDMKKEDLEKFFYVLKQKLVELRVI